MLSLEDLIQHVPLIHNDRTKTWAIHPELARFLDDCVGPDTVSLETGSGLSTLVILRRGPRLHVAVQPNADEFVVIVDFAKAHLIDPAVFRGVVARSQDYLPGAVLPALDLVLIDGDHSFPTPFVDWFYTADRLKVGGLMIVDDIHVGTGAILTAFMESDPKWERIMLLPERFAVYRKRVELIHLGDWVAQPFLRDAFPTAAVRLVRGGADSPAADDATIARALADELTAARELLDTLRAERDHALTLAREALDHIRAMETTKFWRARTLWFRIRKLLGVPGRE